MQQRERMHIPIQLPRKDTIIPVKEMRMVNTCEFDPEQKILRQDWESALKNYVHLMGNSLDNNTFTGIRLYEAENMLPIALKLFASPDVQKELISPRVGRSLAKELIRHPDTSKELIFFAATIKYAFPEAYPELEAQKYSFDTTTYLATSLLACDTMPSFLMAKLLFPQKTAADLGITTGVWEKYKKELLIRETEGSADWLNAFAFNMAALRLLRPDLYAKDILSPHQWETMYQTLENAKNTGNWNTYMKAALGMGILAATSVTILADGQINLTWGEQIQKTLPVVKAF